MSLGRNKKIAALTALVGLLVLAAALIAVFGRGEGSVSEVVSVRGERYLMVTAGVYRYNSQRMVAEGVGWDIFTLLALPFFFLNLRGLWRGTLSSRLLAIGLLAYFFYQYLMYALAWAFGPLFLLFVAIYALALAALLRIAATLELERLQQALGKGFPRRSLIVLCLFMALLLLGMWFSRVSSALQGDLAGGMLLGQTTMVVQALDLGLIVPLALFSAFAIWKRLKIGYPLAAVLLVKAAAMAGAISAMLISAWIVEKSSQLPSLMVFGTIFFVSLFLGWKLLARVEN
jgi:hypothetical protein